jgi:hypothetical protein
VAAAVLGVGVVTALTALDTMLAGASEATQQAAATCFVRAEVGRLETAPWDGNGAYPVVDKSISISTKTSQKTSDKDALQVITVTATDSAGRASATATVLKAAVLSPSSQTRAQGAAGAWCGYLLRAAP